MLPACYPIHVNASRRNPKARRRSLDLPTPEGWVDLGYTAMERPGVELSTSLVKDARTRPTREVSTSVNWQDSARSRCIDSALYWTSPVQSCRRQRSSVDSVIVPTLRLRSSSAVSPASFSVYIPPVTNRLVPASTPSRSSTGRQLSTWNSCMKIGSKTRPLFTRSAAGAAHGVSLTSYCKGVARCIQCFMCSSPSSA